MENKSAYSTVLSYINRKDLAKKVFGAFSSELGKLDKSNPRARALNDGMKNIKNSLKSYITDKRMSLDDAMNDVERDILQGTIDKENDVKWYYYDLALALELLLRYAEQQLGKPLPDNFRSEEFKQLIGSDYYKNYQWIADREAAKSR